jgi:tripartite-type tricarboxylate transporter receptor subunit TctC
LGFKGIGMIDPLIGSNRRDPDFSRHREVAMKGESRWQNAAEVVPMLGLLALVVALHMTGFPRESLAAEAKYPTKPIRMVCPFATGGSTDIAARALASPLQEFLGQPVVVVNVPGAGGAVGFDEVRKSERDGYKMMAAAIGANALVPALNTKLHFKYDELTFVARTQINPNALIVNAQAPWKDFREFAEAMKKSPDKFKFSTAGIGQVSHVGPILVAKALGLKGSEISPVHFESDGQAVLAVVRGDVDFYQGNFNAIAGSLKGGQVRCLAVTTPQRLEVAKEVPTYKELGYPQIDIVGWRGVCGPPDLPESIVRLWEEAVRKTCASQSWLKVVEPLGDFPGYMDSKEFTEFVHSEFKRYRTLFEDAGLLMK